MQRRCTENAMAAIDRMNGKKYWKSTDLTELRDEPAWHGSVTLEDGRVHSGIF
jgi:hypothetical protein